MDTPVRCTWVLQGLGACPKAASSRRMNGYRAHRGPLCERCYQDARKHYGICIEKGCGAGVFHKTRCRRHEHLPLRRLTPGQLAEVRQQILDVIDPDHKTGCWLFNENTVDGYGRIQGKHGIGTWLAHRLAWNMWFDGHANGAELDHLCGTPLCLSPFHLNPATPKANTRLRDIRAENPEFPWHVGKDGKQADPPSWPMGLVMFAVLNGLPAGLPGGDLHRQTAGLR